MAALNGKWTIKDATNLKPFSDALKNSADFTAKLLSIVEGAKAGALKYEEEFIVNRSANTLQLIVYLNGEKFRDHGVVKGDVEFDHTTDDGRQSKMRVVINSDNKVTIYDKNADFDLVTVVEVNGNTLTLNNVGNGQKSLWTFVRSS